MHLGLLVVLGPWGLDHQPGVLIWNGFFILQNLILFGDRSSLPVALPKPRLDVGSILAVGLIALAVLLPFLEPFGRFDHWPAWAVYASRPERVNVFVSDSQTRKLPSQLRRFLELPRWSNGSSHVRIDQWSLHALGVPVYPEARFRIGIALALANRYGLESGIHVEIESSADRWTGERSRRELHGKDEIAQEARRFAFNALPRGRR